MAVLRLSSDAHLKQNVLYPKDFADYCSTFYQILRVMKPYVSDVFGMRGGREG